MFRVRPIACFGVFHLNPTLWITELFFVFALADIDDTEYTLSDDTEISDGLAFCLPVGLFLLVFVGGAQSESCEELDAVSIAVGGAQDELIELSSLSSIEMLESEFADSISMR